MDSLGDIFKAFCKFVDERIFSEENTGTYVAFIVDQTFIDEFCKNYSIKESMLMNAVKSSLYSNRRDHLFVKGILAIQLFAATKRANEEGISEKNYRDRLSQVLNWDMCDLQEWMRLYQEGMWEILYRWCDQHYFLITKCEKRTGTGRYVQYPINQALRVFTNEDLRYIAFCFVDNKLQPGEDIQKKDFKKLIKKYDIQLNIRTNHARLVIKNSLSDEDYYNQVYNFFLRWNGEYKERLGSTKNILKKNAEQLYMYLTDDYTYIELRTAQLSLKDKFDLTTTSYETIAKRYNFKRSGIILFKRDDFYDCYWQEVRFLEGKEEEGLVVCYCQKESDICNKLRPFMVFRNKYVQIFKIKFDFNTREFYSEKRLYKLYGGLKIGYQTYLLGAAPILKLEKPTYVWIDSKAYSEDECEGDISLVHLSEGHHYIKIPDCKRLEFDLVNAAPNKCVWMNDYNQWEIDKRVPLWVSHKTTKGVVGLDFSSISQKGSNISTPTLRRWSELLVLGQSYENETNITLKIIKQTDL